VSRFLTAHQHIRLYSAIHDGCSGKYRSEDKLMRQKILNLSTTQKKSNSGFAENTARQN